jgi:hypothetical protein
MPPPNRISSFHEYERKPNKSKKQDKKQTSRSLQAKRQRWKTQNKKLDNDKTDIVK